eukprot:TRINITY_DN5621_c0_g1_i1.p1 TRINITY_DN5621_c0_g1~~TRINITY_DN5621_c0_g1_i1.p1  ORF type:complete len:395 (+),score=75.25 TRINITY_DN5621_c0_g1_i1:26-1210(+)
MMENTAEPQTLYLRCGRLLDGLGGVKHNVVVCVTGNTIESVQEDTEGVSFEKKDCVVDLRKHTVLPGLIDCHVHLAIADPNDYQNHHMTWSSAYKAIRAMKTCRQLLLAGWTTVRVAGDADIFYSNFDVRRAIKEGHFSGPRITGAAHYLSSTGGGGDFNFLAPEVEHCCCPDGKIVDGVEGMRKAVREEIKHGSDWIKLLVTGTFMSDGDDPSKVYFARDEIEMAVREATMLGVPVMAHAHGTEGIKMAIEAGVRSIEHGSFVDTEAISLMKERGTFLIPTFAVGDWYMKHNQTGNPKLVALHKKLESNFFASMKEAIAAGVKIAVGTDLVGWSPLSFSITEFERLVEFGMTPMQAISAGTSVAAELLRWEKKVGKKKEEESVKAQGREERDF